jgi:CheY-like chemotaxis protein
MVNPYDVIFMDVNMPELDGLEATREIRKALPDGFKQPMIIGLSASASPEDLRIGKEAGMDDYITKPITYSQLEECIEHLVKAKA